MPLYQYSYKFGSSSNECPCGESYSFSSLQRKDEENYEEEQNNYGYCRECGNFFKPTPEDRKDYLHKNW